MNIHCLKNIYEEMKNSYLSKLDSGYWDRHPFEERENREKLRAVFENIQKLKEAAE